MKKHQRAIETERAPSSEEKLSIFTRSVEQFQSAGYVYIGLDHFALPTDELAHALSQGKLQRNFMGYTTRRGGDMVSLGVSAIGDVSGAFVQNAPAESDYIAMVGTKGHAALRGHVRSREDNLRRDVILGLMCNGILQKGAIEARHGIEFDKKFAGELSALQPLESDGLVRLDPDAIRVTPLGQVFLRNIALPFDRYYAERTAKGGDSGRTFSKTL
jgi:oxygen-independent coproporphyrinogen-3 oxidase